MARLRRKGDGVRWCSLHHHSTFSSLDAWGLPEQHLERCAELGINAMALTEHGNVSSHVKLEIAAEKMQRAVQPLYGCEFYVGGTGENATRSKNHITVLARDQDGYRDLLRLMTKGWTDGFYQYPTVEPDWLAETASSFVVLSGCLGSELATHLVGGKMVQDADASFKAGLRVAAAWRERLGDSYFLECQAFHELERTRAVNPMLERISKRLGIPLVATMDCHYPRRDDSIIQQVLHNVRGGGRQTLEEQAQAWGYNVPLCPVHSDKVILRRLTQTGLSNSAAISSILATEEIAQECTGIVLPKLERLRYPMPAGFKGTAWDLMEEWLREGWRFRGFDQLPRRDMVAYKARLRRELGIIRAKDFADYFLVVSDVLRWAKDSGVLVGPARGSAAASLVCYLLRIIEVNPMHYPNLVFERFIDLTREDLPDIDLDFDSRKRSLIYDYLVRKYGEGHVGNIGTFNMYKSKVSLDDVARAFRVPKYRVEEVKDLLIERSSGDLRASATIEDTVEQFESAQSVFADYPDLQHSIKLEGQVRSIGVHAAGLVVANRRIEDVCAVYRRKVKGTVREVIAFDKYDAERQGLIKMDFLGLTTVSMIGECLEEIDMSLDDLYDLPLDDPAVIDRFRHTDVSGIFQFDGRAMRSVCSALRPDSFKELCDINALSRPGPLHNGASTSYIDIKRGARLPETLHPLSDAITAETYYQIVYQEQILRIVREVGGFDWTHAAYIRKIISKKLGEAEFNRQWDRFWSGARERGVPEVIAQTIWRSCITAGAYAFNAAHSVSYAMLAYWTMWFKVYWPQVFYAAALNNLGPGPKGARHLELMRDAQRGNQEFIVPKPSLDIRPPKPGRSIHNWKKEGRRGLRAGYLQIPGVGAATAPLCAELRPRTWDDLLQIKGIGKKTIEKMRAFGAAEDPFGLKTLERKLEAARVSIYESNGWVPDPTHTCEQVPYNAQPRNQNVSVVWMGVITHRNLRDIFEFNRSKYGTELDASTVDRPDLNEWCIMRGKDTTTEICTFAVQRQRYPEFKDIIWRLKPEEDVVVIKGYKLWKLAFRYVFVQDMWIIGTDEAEDFGEEEEVEE